MKTKFLSLVIFLPLFLLAVIPVSTLGRPSFANKPDLSPIGTQNGKLRACQARENAIKTRMSRLTALATRMELKFDKIAQRVENYYKNKVVPSGKTVPDYNSLVADIATQKTAVTTALATAQADVNAFSCTNTNPKTQVTKFREDMQAVKKALKKYRTSVKNLIVAVHSVTGQENRATKTPTPRP